MKYAKTHEWATIDDDDVATVGITQFAQEQLSDVVFVDFPQLGAEVTLGETFMAIESVKAASDIYAPLSGEIIEINPALEGAPEKVNEAPENEGWLVKIKLKHPEEFDQLLSEEDYKASIE